MISELNDLEEIESMLAETLIEWTDGLKIQGRQEGKAAVICHQLTRRFGQLPSQVQGRVIQGTAAQLERWSERLLDAATLDEVFDEERLSLR